MSNSVRGCSRTRQTPICAMRSITGKLTRQAYYEELLRLVYRLIFLFAAEDRGPPAHPECAGHCAKGLPAWLRGGPPARAVHQEYLSRSAPRCLGEPAGAVRRPCKGETRLGLAALGGLFVPLNLADLTRSRIANRRLLKAIWHLSWFRPDGQPMTRVNWRDMQTEELGSVYESLLELIPVVHLETRDFAFTVGDAANMRERTQDDGQLLYPGQPGATPAHHHARPGARRGRVPQSLPIRRPKS